MPVTGPKTGFSTKDPNTGQLQDLGTRYVSKDYLLDLYPNLVPGVTSAGLISVGGRSLAGSNGLGNGNTATSSPTQVGKLTNWNIVSCGNVQFHAIKTDGTLWACGYNSTGQLGNSSTTQLDSPVQIGSLTDWRTVTGANASTFAVKRDGTLWSWGSNSSGQLGNGNRTNISSPVQVGTLTDWKQIATASNTAIALKTDGTLWAWGQGTVGAIGNGATSSYSSPVQVGALTNWKQVAGFAGGGTFYALRTDGTIWGWGLNDKGQLGIGTTTPDRYSSPIQVGSLTTWKQVACGYRHFVAIKTDGTLWACGYNLQGQLGIGTSVSVSSPVQVGTLTNWKSVTCGQNYTAAIKTDGSLWTWGDNYWGELGTNVNTVSYYSSPVQVGSLTNWRQVSCSLENTMAISIANI